MAQVTNDIKIIKLNPSDIFVSRKWSFFMIGFGTPKGTGYIAYIVILFIFYTYVHNVSLYAMYLVSHDMGLFVDALHVYMCALWIYWCLVVRVATNKWIEEMRSMIAYGIYRYEEEEFDNEQIVIQKNVSKNLRMGGNIQTSIYVITVILVMIFFPLSEYFFFKDSRKFEESVINPYLPHTFYSPFNKTFWGYITAYIIDLLFWFYTYCTAASTTIIFGVSALQLKVHLKILNHSLRNIHQRAYLMYKRKYNNTKNVPVDKIFERKEFQKCLHLCLRSNVQHHQALLRFKSVCHPFNGSCISNVFSAVTVVIYALILYQIYQKPPVNVMVKYASMFVAEQSFSFLLCIFGEDVMVESGKLFESLYSTLWFDYDKNFKQTLHIMMCNVRKPILIKSLILNYTASLESYGDLFSAIYKVLNLMLQSNKMK